MNHADVLTAWRELHGAPSASISGVRARGMPSGIDAWLAADARKQPYLLVRVSEEPGAVRWQTQGLVVWIDRFAVGHAPEDRYLAVRCADPLFVETFSLVVSDILTRLTRSPGEVVNTVLQTLERWKVFWKVPQQGLSREAALGLFGELWFLSRWLRPWLREGLGGWQGPAGSRHDFQFPALSVEVKTAGGQSAVGPVHRIHGLDQLDDPESGSLYLFSLHAVEDQLASNELPALVEQIESLVHPHADVLDSFRVKLAALGYSPGHAERYRQRYRILAENLYEVSGSFPRLTRASFPEGLPPGIQDVSYALAVAHCTKWRVAKSPSEARLLSALHAYVEKSGTSAT